jgi:hypothetical protein
LTRSTYGTLLRRDLLRLGGARCDSRPLEVGEVELGLGPAIEVRRDVIAERPVLLELAHEHAQLREQRARDVPDHHRCGRRLWCLRARFPTRIPTTATHSFDRPDKS